MAGGTMVARSAISGSTTSAVYIGADAAAAATYEPMAQMPTTSYSALRVGGPGEIVVLRSMRQVGGSLLPMSDDRLLDGADLAITGDASATSVAATAPLWPTAHMAAHAAHRFAAMEFGDVMPVSTQQIQR
jgi:hypothetical protein